MKTVVVAEVVVAVVALALEIGIVRNVGLW
jgi:hypothetical protein